MYANFLSVPSVLRENFLGTLPRDSFDIPFHVPKLFYFILLCLSLVSLVSLGKSKVLGKNSKPFYAICMRYLRYLYDICMLYTGISMVKK